jgi:hypothetical protein
LLKLQNEMRVRRASGSIEIWLEMKEQHVLQIIEDRLVHRRVTAFGCVDCALHDLAIFFAHRLIRCEIRSINREAGDGLTDYARKRLQREISIPPISL